MGKPNGSKLKTGCEASRDTSRVKPGLMRRSALNQDGEPVWKMRMVMQIEFAPQVADRVIFMAAE